METHPLISAALENMAELVQKGFSAGLMTAVEDLRSNDHEEAAKFLEERVALLEGIYRAVAQESKREPNEDKEEA